MPNDSLTKFANILYTEAVREKERIAKQLEEEKREILEKKQEKLDKKFRKETENCRNTLERELKLAVSRRENELSKMLRQKRADAAAEVFKEAAAKLEEYTKTPRYKEYLKREFDAVASEFSEGKTVCFVKKCDAELVKTVCPIRNVTFEIADDGIIGGFTLKNVEKRICADCTLKTKLSEQEDLFLNISGLVIE